MLWASMHVIYCCASYQSNRHEKKKLHVCDKCLKVTRNGTGKLVTCSSEMEVGYRVKRGAEHGGCNRRKDSMCGEVLKGVEAVATGNKRDTDVCQHRPTN